jgi:hypothetical protein
LLLALARLTLHREYFPLAISGGCIFLLDIFRCLFSLYLPLNLSLVVGFGAVLFSDCASVLPTTSAFGIEPKGYSLVRSAD